MRNRVKVERANTAKRTDRIDDGQRPRFGRVLRVQAVPAVDFFHHQASHRCVQRRLFLRHEKRIHRKRRAETRIQLQHTRRNLRVRVEFDRKRALREIPRVEEELECRKERNGLVFHSHARESLDDRADAARSGVRHERNDRRHFGVRPGPQLRVDREVSRVDHAPRLALAVLELRLHRYGVRKRQAARAVRNAVQHCALVEVVHVVVDGGFLAGQRGDGEDVAVDFALFVEGGEEGFEDRGERIVNFVGSAGELDRRGVEIAAFSREDIT